MPLHCKAVMLSPQDTSYFVAEKSHGSKRDIFQCSGCCWVTRSLSITWMLPTITGRRYVPAPREASPNGYCTAARSVRYSPRSAAAGSAAPAASALLRPAGSGQRVTLPYWLWQSHLPQHGRVFSELSSSVPLPVSARVPRCSQLSCLS